VLKEVVLLDSPLMFVAGHRSMVDTPPI